MAGAGAQTQIARYREQLREASVTLGADLNGRRTSFGSPRQVEASPFDQCRAELKRAKFAFSDADMKGTLIKGCVDRAAPWDAVDEQRSAMWQEAKRRNKELKNARLREEQAQKQLHSALAEAFEEARQSANQANRELEMLQSQQDEGIELGHHAGEGEDLDLCPSWANGPHGEAAEDARRGTNELSRVASLRRQELEKRGRFEAELQQLERQLKQSKDQSKACRQQQKEAQDHADSLEKVHQAQLQLGFPEIVFHESAQFDGGSSGTVVLEGDTANVDKALRVVGVEFGRNGELTLATPHASLGLLEEAADAVKRDDLPWLLTMAWHRICDPAEPKRRPSRGGA